MIQQPILRRPRAAMPSARVSGQRGFTLLEILVAIVVLSIGLLGLAGLQVVSLTNNQTAHYRSIATQQAYDMADRMRANLGTPGGGGVRGGSYDDLTFANTPANDPDCVANACTQAQMAQADHFQWQANTGRLLPNGQGFICAQALPCPGLAAPNNLACPGNAFRIRVSWNEKAAVGNAAAGNVTQTFVTCVIP